MAATNGQMSPSDRVEGDSEVWKAHAACRAITPDLFFPLGSTGDALEQIEAAKEVCQACAVRHECLRYALETNQDAGVWGGTSEDERRTLRATWRAGRRLPSASSS